MQSKRLWLQIKKRRFVCKACGKIFTETFESIRPRSHRTIRYEKFLYEQGKMKVFKDVALEDQMKYTTFRRLWYRCAQEQVTGIYVDYPRVCGIDEFSVARRHEYHTVITDLERHKVATTLAGRDKKGSFQ